MLKDEDLLLVKGGSLSGALVDAVINLMKSIFNYGRSLGSTIKRVVSKNYCKWKINWQFFA